MIFISYAKNFEDVMLRRVLNHGHNGFYIDIGAMAHVKPYFECLYEYSRFHLFFFGKSKDHLMQQADLQPIEEAIDGDAISHVMIPTTPSEHHV